MPFNSRNSNSSRSSAPSSRGGRRTTKAAPAKGRAKGDYNMMSFGVGFFDEDGKYPKVRILLKKDDAKKGITDENEVQYTREEAAALLAEALLEGRGISLYLFENDDGSMSGNARIYINGLSEEEEEEPAPKAQAKRSVKPVTKRTYPALEVDEDEEEIQEEDESELPY